MRKHKGPETRARKGNQPSREKIHVPSGRGRKGRSLPRLGAESFKSPHCLLHEPGGEDVSWGWGRKKKAWRAGGELRKLEPFTVENVSEVTGISTDALKIFLD